MMIDFEIEDIDLKDGELGTKILQLPVLTDNEISVIDPIVAPTSGLRIEIFDVNKKEGKEKYLLTRRKFFLFLRVFKAISEKFKEHWDSFVP